MESKEMIQDFIITNYKHQSSEFRLIHIDSPKLGPLSSASIIVDEPVGTPHCLEHLCFCGSDKYNRGYLDTLATRCLSMGTNAYTTDDHTAFTVTTASPDGMKNILPVLLNHVLSPTLTDSQYLTEVCGIDGTGKYRGVVFCEMEARENNEGDLTDYNSKRLIYQLLEKHSKEMNPKMKSLLLYNSGGRCNDIIKLDNTQVKLFHDEFYHYDNITVLILGQDLNLNEFDWDLNQTRNETLQTNIELIQNNFELNHRDWTLINHFDPSQKNILETFPKLSEYHITHFPSTETKFASITMNWILPADTTDYFQQLETAFAVDILWKCLYETTASILNHAFVSRREFGSLNINEELEPFADDVCAAVSCGTWSNEWCGIAELVFSGISLETNPLIENFKREFSEQELLNVYSSFLYTTLKSNQQNINHSLILSVLKKQKILYFENLEDNPHSILSSLLTSEIVRFRHLSTVPSFTIGLQIPQMIDNLLQKDYNYWMKIYNQFILEAPCSILLLVPDAELATQLNNLETKCLNHRLEQCDLLKLNQEFEDAVLENQVNLNHDTVFPVFGSLKTGKTSNGTSSIVDLSDLPCSQMLLVQADTVFVHFKLCLGTQNLPSYLKPYLVMFQELLFQSNLKVENTDFQEIMKLARSAGYSSQVQNDVIDYRALALILEKELVHYDCGVGFGNETFGCNWFSELFVIQGQGIISNDSFPLPDSIHHYIMDTEFSDSLKTQLISVFKLVSWLFMILFNCEFGGPQISITKKNLLFEISECKKEGSEMASALMTKHSLGSSLKTRKRQKLETYENESSISIFTQEPFLKKVNEVDLVQKLNELRQCLINSNSGFIQMVLPKQDSNIEFILKSTLSKLWKYFCKTLNSTEITCLFPYSRTPYHRDEQDPVEFHQIESLASYYISQMVPCNILSNFAHHPDYHAVILLCELLSRNEGPVYSCIRGRGYAYHASVSISLWNGQLYFDVSDCSEPFESLKAWKSILHDVHRKLNENIEVFSNNDLECAISSLLYRNLASISNYAGFVSHNLRRVLCGFPDDDSFSKLQLVTIQDLKRVFKTYFMSFLDIKSRITVLVGPSPCVDFIKLCGSGQ